MTNEIQKQEKRYDDVWSTMLRMKDLYVVPNPHIRYAAMMAFFSTRMIEDSFVREHGVMMLSLVKKLKDVQTVFKREETYIDVILQSLPSSFDQFIVNYNMNGLDKSLQ
ncbi:UNVERIFIED_CONTAM: hypothetical protein Sangu_1170700 [Sesamum angustifolium]|uniref:Uncharacterized protein n=1 Tax=Sesamum angustifolium TaxID=2727405 RepID=A0AAW2P0A3_9LAMI